MDLENNDHLPSDISQFLDQFEKENSELERAFAAGNLTFNTPSSAAKGEAKSQDKDHSFKKLEEKISELEHKFETSLKEKNVLLSELAKSKEENEQNKNRDEFFTNISSTIANLKESVDRLSRAQQMPQRPVFMSPTEIYGQGYYYGAPIDQASKFGQEQIFKAEKELAKYSAEVAKNKETIAAKEETINKQQEDMDLQNQTITAQKQEIYQHKADKEENERFIASLKEKTSRLKAVNSALEKEFKRVQDEKIEALRKSAEQAKEILSLRDQLTQAEERFKSFDFEGRIISIKNHYQQKVSKLETQLQEMSAVCMKQVEEIENLKTENMRLQKVDTERQALIKQLEDKDIEINNLKAEVERITKLSEQAMHNLSASDSEALSKIQQAEEAAKLKITEAYTAAQNKIKETEEAAKSKISAAYAETESKVKAAKEEAAKAAKEEAERLVKEREYEVARRAAQRIREISQKANTEIALLNNRLLEAKKEKEIISSKIQSLHVEPAVQTEDKKKADENFKALMAKIKENDSVIENLKKKIEVLDGENKNLKDKPKKEVHPPSAPVQEGAMKISAPVKKDSPQTLQYPDPAARSNPSRAKAAALGEGGEKDFLEDTQTFFGRIKWSLLKDD